ncbi:hypothetical protein K2173_002494 [Erythroxylum novogranatense]|uniref:Cysteine-rich transmembrane CYSTM domain-containing protein n=1 Tax=Erythroxylum novogranatense TaxID=1862640 RepID=A0AAV8TTM4_9ROSI|nr:hypothetical protein K2173_002494 [Erythroxylum novogranatense]
MVPEDQGIIKRYRYKFPFFLSVLKAIKPETSQILTERLSKQAYALQGSVNVGTGNQGAIKKGSVQQKAEKKMSYYNQQQPPVGVPPVQVHVYLQGYPPQGYAPQYAQPPQGYAPQHAQPPPNQKTGCLKECSALCCCCLHMIACFGPFLSC